MFVLYALVVGVIAGFAVGGRLDGLARLEFRWGWLLVGGLMVQVILFSDTVASVVGPLGAWIYVASTAVVLAGVLRNASIPGIPVVALGAASNLAAILANGGYMPAGAAAMAALGKSDPTTYSNSAVVAHPALGALTDIFALPPWLPFANIFSIGDVAIFAGTAWVIVAAMRHRPAAALAAPRPNGEPGPNPATG